MLLKHYRTCHVEFLGLTVMSAVSASNNYERSIHIVNKVGPKIEP
jgi:hypothetical protein